MMRDIVEAREESLTCLRSKQQWNASRAETRSAFDQTFRKFVPKQYQRIVKTYFKEITKS